MRLSTGKRQVRTGYTLIELLVALALVGVVLIAAGTMLLQAYANEEAYREQNEAQRNARVASDILTDDLRGAKRIWLYPSITRGTPVRISVLNNNYAPTFVRYWLEGTDMMREADTNTRRLNGLVGKVVARNITALSVSTNTTGNVATIVVTAVVGGSSDPNDPYSTVSIRSDVNARNISR